MKEPFRVETFDLNMYKSDSIQTSGSVQTFAQFEKRALVWSETVPKAKDSEYFIQYCQVNTKKVNDKDVYCFLEPKTRI
jgi:hypothetical protein